MVPSLHLALPPLASCIAMEELSAGLELIAMDPAAAGAAAAGAAAAAAVSGAFMQVDM